MAEELVGPPDNSRHVDGRRNPSRPVFIGNLGTERRHIRVIEPDLVLNDAGVPNSMKIGFGACPLNRNEVSAAVIVEGHMQGLMDVANPMPEAFEEPKLIAHIETEGEIACVVQDRGDDTAIGNRARMRNLDAFG